MLWWRLLRLKSKLASPNPIVRKETASTLGSIQSSKSVDLLIHAMADNDTDVKNAVNSSLVRLGFMLGSIAVRPLKASLSGGNIDAKRVLSRIADTLLPQLKSSYPNWAMQMLAEIGDARAIRPLIEMLENSLATARMEAARALGQFGSEAGEAVPALDRLLMDHALGGMIRETAAVALSDIIGQEDAALHLVASEVAEKLNRPKR